MKKNLRELSKLRDSISYVYFEHAVLEQDEFSLVAIREDGRIPIPVASTTCILLGPGTSITHSAVRIASENGCMIIWCGEKIQRFYAAGLGETRNSDNLMFQVEACMNENRHMRVIRRMYLRRFGSIPDQHYTLQQLRGMEGIRVREAYRFASRVYGIPWKGRNYKDDDWDAADPLNQALSYANTILYGICHASIVSLGFSPAIGFIHTGKQLSFVYDIADLYKADISIPSAFSAVKEFSMSTEKLEQLVRKKMRIEINNKKLMRRIPEDLEWIFDIGEGSDEYEERVGNLWNQNGSVQGGKNWGDINYNNDN